MYFFRLLLTLLTLSTFSLVAFYAAGQPKIHFTEFKILLTEETPSLNYRLFNRGEEDALCRTSFIDYLVSEDGSLSLPADGHIPENSAISLLRSSPSQIVIPPHSSQKIKVLIRGLKKLADGELNSYFSVMCKDNLDSATDQINLVPNFVFNIPIMARAGKLVATASIKEVKLVNINKNHQVELVLNRTGNRSLYGDFSVIDGSGSKIGALNGVSHYIQSTNMPLKITLDQPPILPLTINFTESERFGGKQSVTYTIN